MMGIPVAEQRDRMEEALEAILLLLRSDEPVTMKTDWFTLDDARLQPAAVHAARTSRSPSRAQVSPSGPRAAGRFGMRLLSIGATNQQGFDLLGYHWQIAEERAAQFGTPIDRRNWRLVGPMHIAETKEQAYADVEFGLAEWVDYFQRVAALPIAPDTRRGRAGRRDERSPGFAVIGTPDDAIAQIERSGEQSNGGFGTFLVMAHDWADRASHAASYELLARYVFPAFQGSADSTTSSRDWAAENRPTFIGEAGAAIMTAIGKHNAEHEAVQAANCAIEVRLRSIVSGDHADGRDAVAVPVADDRAVATGAVADGDVGRPRRHGAAQVEVRSPPIPHADACVARTGQSPAMGT